ncbi:MAG: hypothetical protein KAS17_01470, partial [Victivallaceae bacterium]|nr:hypothetical protein [Victivallaceae bacterium]
MTGREFKNLRRSINYTNGSKSDCKVFFLSLAATAGKLVIMSMCVSFLCAFAARGEKPNPTMWELKLLGIDNANKLKELRNASKQRRVSLGIVGQSGVSEKRLKKLLDSGSTITYHGCRSSAKSTHDTGQLKVTLELTSVLGAGVDIHVWQPGKSSKDIAEKFREAAAISHFRQGRR